MHAGELGEILGKMYRNALPNESVVMIHLYGVRHADVLRSTDISISDVVRAAGISKSYVVEINKAINLAKYVRER